MKKILFSTIVLAFILVSCNQKNKENTTVNPTMLEKDTTTIRNDSTMMNDKTKMMNDNTKMYSCPMHPEVQGKMNDKCSKCGMKLTEPVPEKEEK